MQQNEHDYRSSDALGSSSQAAVTASATSVPTPVLDSHLQASAAMIRSLAKRLFITHGISGQGWNFRFDHAKRRAGSCNYNTRTITVTKHLIGYQLEQVEQVLLHEIAHALAGQGAGHGPRWKRIAQEIGYLGKRTLDLELARDEAKWVGSCPAGHEVYRFRRPTGVSSCKRCYPRFNARYRIEWQERIR